MKMQMTRKRKIEKGTCAIGSDEKAAIAGIEVEREVLNERSRTWRRMAVDARVSEFQLLYLNYW